MHELPVMQQVLEIVLRHARKNQVQHVLAVHIEVGTLSDLQEVWMQRYFDQLSQNTLAAGARLCILRKPAVMSCRDCAQQFQADFQTGADLLCAHCGSRSLKLVSGREYTVLNLEAV